MQPSITHFYNRGRGRRPGLFLTCLLALTGLTGFAQTPQPPAHARWDELTASDWPKALTASSHTCILPIGILEKHGPHVPIGSDLIMVREWSARATKKEYAVVFPDYFYGQINEARHQPGSFALPERVVWDLLEATCDEIARNGFDKIVIINGHGGRSTQGRQGRYEDTGIAKRIFR
jgi:creatinine amidohydrolase